MLKDLESFELKVSMYFKFLPVTRYMYLYLQSLPCDVVHCFGSTFMLHSSFTMNVLCKFWPHMKDHVSLRNVQFLPV